MSARITHKRLILTGLAAVMLGTAALACAPPPDRTPPTITSFTISPRVGGFWSDGVLYYWIRGVATVSVTADAGAGDTVTAINCTSTAGVVTGGAYNPTTPAQVRSRTFTLDVQSLSHGTDFWVKVTATDSHSNTTNPEDHKLRNRAHAIDLQGQPQVTIGLAVEYPARSGTEVQPGAEVCNAVQPRFRINIPWPRIDPSKDAVEFVMQEAPNPPYEPGQPWHPGQREQSQHTLGDYEQVFTTQGKTLLYTWDTGGMIWPQYHFTQYKHNGPWNERGTFKWHWWWEPTYQGNPITSRGISTEPAPNPPPGPWTVIEPLALTTRNLTIGNATASGGVGASGEYWLFDPAQPNLPLVVTYETDKLLNETAAATLKVYSADRSDDTPLREITASATTDASGQQIVWDGTVNGQPVDKGIYVFDLKVEAQGSPYEPESGLMDQDDHKSQKTRITSTGIQEVGWDEGTRTTTIRITYRLEDDYGEPASSAEIRVYKPDLTLYGTYPCTGLSPGQDYSVDIPVVMDEGGIWYFLLCPTDSHHTRDKAHRDRLVVPRNRQVKQPTVGVMWQSDYPPPWEDLFGDLDTADECGTRGYDYLVGHGWSGRFDLGDQSGGSWALKRHDQGGADKQYFDNVDLAMWVGHGPGPDPDGRPYLLFVDGAKLKWDDIRWGDEGQRGDGVKWVGLFTCRFLYEHTHELSEVLSMCQGVHLICGWYTRMTVTADSGKWWTSYGLGDFPVGGPYPLWVVDAWFEMHKATCEVGRIARVIGAKSARQDYLYGVKRVHPWGDWPVSADPPPYSAETAELYDKWDCVKSEE